MTNRLLVSVFVIGLAAGCGKKAGPAIDKVDVAALKDGASQTLQLSFWSKNRGLAGEDLVDNVHFEDRDKQPIALRFDPALAPKVAALAKGKVYKVTFTVKDDAVHKGVMTAVE